MNLIETIDLKKAFKKFEAVKGISIEIKEGEILGILGPNGAGKSTTISMISTLISPTGGKILLRGVDIFAKPSLIRNILGVVPQDIALYTDLTGYENLKFFGKVYGLKGKDLEKRVEEVQDIIGLNGRINELVKNYSGGMKRRVNIGAALMHNPQILIMDEPTVGIDPQSRNHILETVKRLNEKGMTIVYTSHYMEEVEYLCDRIYIMDHGKVITSGTKEELKESLSGEETVELTVDIVTEDLVNELKRHSQVNNVLVKDNVVSMTTNKGQSFIGDIFTLATKHNTRLNSVNVKTPTLEDVFLSLTGRGLRD